MSNSEDERIVSLICTFMNDIKNKSRILRNANLPDGFKKKIVTKINSSTAQLKDLKEYFPFHFLYANSLLFGNIISFFAPGDWQNAVKLGSSNECYTCTSWTDPNCSCTSYTGYTTYRTYRLCNTIAVDTCPSTIFITPSTDIDIDIVVPEV
jgi:hypothetical protein